MGLRLREGIDLEALGARLGLDVEALLRPVLQELTAAGCFETVVTSRRPSCSRLNSRNGTGGCAS